jgi:hypothetical protein
MVRRRRLLIALVSATLLVATAAQRCSRNATREARDIIAQVFLHARRRLVTVVWLAASLLLLVVVCRLSTRPADCYCPCCGAERDRRRGFV